MPVKAPLTWPATGAIRRLAESPSFAGSMGQIDAGFEAFIKRTCELAQLPAPTFHETGRATWVADQMREIGLQSVRADDDANVTGLLPGDEPGIVVAAHMDTVFGEDEDHSVHRENGRLRGRGVGDNTIGLTAMLEVAKALRAHGGRKRAVWFAATVGEEGLGNLRGVRAVVDEIGDAAGGFIAVEGHFLGRICTSGVGSRRWRITVRGSGGHSWHDYGAPSAVHTTAEIIMRLTSLELPARPRTTLNVGRVEGGEGVNVIARKALLELDLRSENQDQLEMTGASIEEIVDEITRARALEVDAVLIGDRPAARTDNKHPLVAAAAEALRCVGLEPAYEAASTDANYPGSLGIPSVCIGVTRGGGMHTPREWVEEAPARDGLRQLALLVAALSGVEE